jgi:ATP-dependent RNA helicase DDX49/DBP8
VLNYEVPANPTDYIHRIGRTARAGRGGLSLSIVTEKDLNIIKSIEDLTRKKLQEYDVSEDDALDLLNKVGLAKRVARMQLLESKFGEKSRINSKKRQSSTLK